MLEEINKITYYLLDREQLKEAEQKKVESLLLPVGKYLYELEDKENKRIHESKERFNVFNCLTKHHLEELHSKFLTYLLDPTESHDCGSLFLKLFLETIQPTLNSYHFDIDQAYSEVEVKREKKIDKCNVADGVYGRIDIYIETVNLNIAIENKIDAKEQENQIERYYKYCNSLNKNFIILYLTLDGKKSNQSGEVEYFCISYKHEIINWLEKCIQNTLKYPIVSSGVKYYKDLINNSLLKTPNNNINMEMIDFLLIEENKIIIKYLKTLYETNTQIRNHLRNEFFQKTTLCLNQNEIKFIPVSGIVHKTTTESIWAAKNRGLLCINEHFIYNIDDEHKVYFAIEHNWSNLWYGLFGIRTIKGERSTFDLTEYDLSKKIEFKVNQRFNGNLEVEDSWWLSWKRFYPFKEKVNFDNDDLNYEFATSMNEAVEKFVKEIEIYLFHWKEVILELEKEKIPLETDAI